MMSDQLYRDEVIVMVPWVPSKKDTWKDILRPVTIFQVLQAEPSPFLEDRSLVIEGRGFATVTLVAHVASVEISPANVVYKLEDGTGRIFAEKNFSSLKHQFGLSEEAEREETTQCQAFEHTYVEVTGYPRKHNLSRTRIEIRSIHPVQDYHHVLYHILNVIHSNILTQRHTQPYNTDEDFGFNGAMETSMPVDDDQAYQDDISIQHHTTCAIQASHPVLPNTFSPRKHRPYATLKPLERAIMKYMRHHRNHHVLIAELAQAVQTSSRCTEHEFSLAIQTLLSEAYITSPLDDGHVIITPRYRDLLSFMNLPLQS